MVETHPLSTDLLISLVFYAFALGSKEIGILYFPLVYLIFAKGRPSDKISGRATLPIFRVISFGVLAALYFAVRWLAFGAISLPAEDGVSFKETILTIPAIFVFYVRQIILPVWLGPNHDVRRIAEIKQTSQNAAQGDKFISGGSNRSRHPPNLIQKMCTSLKVSPCRRMCDIFRAGRTCAARPPVSIAKVHWLPLLKL